MDYYELRTLVSKITPRQTRFLSTKVKGSIKEKGRKANYYQFNLLQQGWNKQERLLNTEEVASFLEVSLRAQACPMPLNLDVWDAKICPYNCHYCFANAFRDSLYTSFFDNSRTLGIRHCSPDYYKSELDKLFKYRGKKVDGADERIKAISMNIPMRFGIRFEDFLPIEGKKKISLALLNYLKENAYPVMINTKSELIGREDYVRALADNPAKAAVHITMITSDDNINKRLEPGAPSFAKRIEAAKSLADAGVRVVARIEPFMTFINDEPDEVEHYMQMIHAAGIRHMTFDTYSYSANNPRIRAAFYYQGYDFERMFTLMSDCQWLGSLLLGKFMDLFRDYGLQCSTFDMGNVPTNDDLICCCVGDWFQNSQWNLGSIVPMVRFIIHHSPKAISWEDYNKWVGDNWLSQNLKQQVHGLWNLIGNTAYCPDWAPGIVPVGVDQYGKIWKYDVSLPDFRMEMLKKVI